MSQPLVSIAIPSYNHSAYIEACLASVCAQTYSELELVLIDDGSTDGTFEIAQRFLEPFRDRFRRVVLERRKNQGVSANSNACIEACQGEWVHLLGSDDLIYPNKVERIQEHIAAWNTPDLVLVHADIDYIDQHGGPTTRQRQKGRPVPGPLHGAYRDLFMEEYFVFNPTVTLRRDAFLDIGGFDQNLRLEDIDCWLRLSVGHSIARVPEALASYRKHPGNTSRKRTMMLSAQFLTYAKFLESNPGLICDEDLRSHFRRKMKRFWRRSRKQKPWLAPLIATEVLQSFVRSPSAKDYRRYGEKLALMKT